MPLLRFLQVAMAQSTILVAKQESVSSHGGSKPISSRLGKAYLWRGFCTYILHKQLGKGHWIAAKPAF